MKKAVGQFLGLSISLVLVVWMLVVVEWAEVFTRLSGSNYLMLIPATVVIVGHYVARAWRWRFLLPDSSDVRFRSLIDGIMVGNFASYFLPLRAGEFVRPFVLARSSKYSFSSGFSSVVMERFFDLAAVLITFVYVLFSVPNMPQVLYQGAGALVILATGLLLFILIGVFSPRLAEVLIDFGLKFLPSKIAVFLRRFLMEFIAGTQVLKDPKRFCAVVLLTAVVWASGYLFFWTFAELVRVPEVHGTSGYFVSTAVAVVVALAVAAPSSPGFVGVYQAGCTIGYAIFGIDTQTAITFALLSHVFQYLLFGSYGVHFLISNGLKFSDLRKAANKN